MNFIERLFQEIKFLTGSFLTNRHWSLTEVGQFWDSVADYDDINEHTYSYFRRFTDGYQLCSIPPESNVLDICARTGNGTKYFFERGLIRSATCVDVSQTFKDLCTQHLESFAIPYKHVLVSDYRLPFKDSSFDAVLCFETIEHLSEPERLLFELRRVLCTGGEMILTTPNVLWEPIHSLAAITGLHHSEGPHRFIRRRSLIKMLEQAGFMIQRESTTVLIPGGPGFLIRFGEQLEDILPECFKRMVCLRRIFICVAAPTEQDNQPAA